jgi:hypothetical protein
MPCHKAVMTKTDDIATTLTMRLRRSTVDSIARIAKRQKCSKKLVLCTALAKGGIAVAPADLADKTPRRPVVA